ncbi:MAG: lysylphosphatidylglycerol synthase domain-containing protein [Candidatus Cloacimonetes bacterium]|jgi:uncharacterized membrane protein YbhN (UPF0104 family)|nr:flippase-like domain-containing protein [Candidatus Cloacimonadota bacterium]MDD4155765.1 lysylphosphatidylglycerol synthase domain-containing protein [Candidatus Cloacimonadota bacterium]
MDLEKQKTHYIKRLYLYIKDNPYKNYFKILLSVIILVIIFFKIKNTSDIGNVFLPIIKTTSVKSLVMLLLISVMKFFTQVFNWYYVLKINQDYDCTFRQVIKTHTIGLALRFFMPGGHATFGKVFYINPDKKKETFFSIIAEKFFQSWIIWFFAIWSFLFYYDKNYLLVLFIALLITFVPFIIPKIFKRHIPYMTIFNYYKILPKVILSQILFVFMTFIQYYLILSQLTQIRFFNTAISVSLILVANTIPITFSGLGLRETAATIVLPKYGIPIELAVGTSLCIFVLNSVIPALPGVFLISSKNKGK